MTWINPFFIHALRHTFGTHLSMAGVPPRVAMAAMRHSSLELTMNIYTDPVLLDVGAAIEALPAFAGEKPTLCIHNCPILWWPDTSSFATCSRVGVVVCRQDIEVGRTHQAVFIKISSGIITGIRIAAAP